MKLEKQRKQPQTAPRRQTKWKKRRAKQTQQRKTTGRPRENAARDPYLPTYPTFRQNQRTRNPKPRQLSSRRRKRHPKRMPSWSPSLRARGRSRPSSRHRGPLCLCVGVNWGVVFVSGNSALREICVPFYIWRCSHIFA